MSPKSATRPLIENKKRRRYHENEERRAAQRRYLVAYVAQNRERFLVRRRELYRGNKEYYRNYYVEHRDEVLACRRTYYAKHRDERLAYQHRYNEEHREEQVAYQHRYNTRQKVKRQALAGKRLRVVLTDYVKDFCQSLEKEGSPSSTTSSTPVETALGSKTLPVVLTDYRTLPSANVPTPVVSDTLTDLDLGELQPWDHPAWDNETNQWLDDLMELLEDPLDDREELEDVGDSSFDLDDFVSMSPGDMNDVTEDMSLDEWEALMEDVDNEFDLDDFVS